MKLLADVADSTKEWLHHRWRRLRKPNGYWCILYLHAALPAERLRMIAHATRDDFEWVTLTRGLELTGEREWQRPLLTFTYDDADYSVFEEALQVHAELKMPAALFVCPRYIEEGVRYVSEDEVRRTMTWAQIREWRAAGLEVGAHTVNHIPLNQASVRRAKEEILQSARMIEDQIGDRVIHFSYPWGCYSDAVAQWIEDEPSIASAVTTEFEYNYAGMQGKHLRRRPPPEAGFDWSRRLRCSSLYQILHRRHYRRVLNAQVPVFFYEQPEQVQRAKRTTNTWERTVCPTGLPCVATQQWYDRPGANTDSTSGLTKKDGLLE